MDNATKSNGTIRIVVAILFTANDSAATKDRFFNVSNHGRHTPIENALTALEAGLLSRTPNDDDVSIRTLTKGTASLCGHERDE
jgi:hypothetical protein